jgi:putative ABC transport system ATP-binding protein
MPQSFFKNKGVEVQISGVVKTYRMAAEEVHALRETSWDVRTGQAVAIMGPSGCGKTTLLNLLGGVDRPTAGKILVDRQDLTAMNERALEKHRLLKVGFVFQFFNLIPSITAFENLELPMVMAGVPEADCRERARLLLGLVGLDAKGQKRPEELSGGEQQRVAVALALANDPSLILADEPTGNLDSS